MYSYCRCVHVQRGAEVICLIHYSCKQSVFTAPTQVMRVAQLCGCEYTLVYSLLRLYCNYQFPVCEVCSTCMPACGFHSGKVVGHSQDNIL